MEARLGAKLDTVEVQTEFIDEEEQAPWILSYMFLMTNLSIYHFKNFVSVDCTQVGTSFVFWWFLKHYCCYFLLVCDIQNIAEWLHLLVIAFYNCYYLPILLLTILTCLVLWFVYANPFWMMSKGGIFSTNLKVCSIY